MLTKISYTPAYYKANKNFQTEKSINTNKTAQVSFGMLPAKAISKNNVELLEKIAQKLKQGPDGVYTKTINNKTITLNRFPKSSGEIRIKEKNGSELKINNIFYGEALNLEYLEKTKKPSITSMRLAYGKDGKGYEFEPGEILRYKSQYPQKGVTLNVERTYCDRSVVNAYFNEERLNKLNGILKRILPDALL